MKFNEKELALWASSFVSDREGLLDKKGAARGQGEGRERERKPELLELQKKKTHQVSSLNIYLVL